MYIVCTYEGSFQCEKHSNPTTNWCGIRVPWSVRGALTWKRISLYSNILYVEPEAQSEEEVGRPNEIRKGQRTDTFMSSSHLHIFGILQTIQEIGFSNLLWSQEIFMLWYNRSVVEESNCSYNKIIVLMVFQYQMMSCKYFQLFKPFHLWIFWLIKHCSLQNYVWSTCWLSWVLELTETSLNVLNLQWFMECKSFYMYHTLNNQANISALLLEFVEVQYTHINKMWNLNISMLMDSTVSGRVEMVKAVILVELI